MGLLIFTPAKPVEMSAISKLPSQIDNLCGHPDINAAKCQEGILQDPVCFFHRFPVEIWA
jgi:hypothetical protein